MKLQRHPYAMGITSWGPLPDTENMYIMWDGPGSGLYLYPHDPDLASSAALGMRIRHTSASSLYGTLKQAGKAVHAFVAIGLSAKKEDEA